MERHANEDRTRQPECSACRYDLTGFAAGDTCPECGVTITDLYPPLDDSQLARASAICGGCALFLLFMSFAGAYPLALGFLFFGWAGTIVAVIARVVMRRAPRRYAGRSMVVARCGFWMSVPAVIVIAVAFGVDMLRPLVYG